MRCKHRYGKVALFGGRPMPEPRGMNVDWVRYLICWECGDLSVIPYARR